MLDSLRGIAPKFAVRTTFIAGFPGETEEQCDELCRFIEEQKFARSGCFAYSPEEGTAAERLPDQLEGDVKTARADAVNRACYNQTLDFQLGRVGGEELAICDGFDSEKGVYILRGEYDAPEIDTVILLESDATLIEGEFYKVTITGTDDVDLTARLSD